MKYLVIVESPTKAKTISRFLPDEYILEATVGHLRNLPQSAQDIPESYKKTKWARLGIDVENNFSPLYIIEKNKKKIIDTLKKKLKSVNAVYLGTDEDREGESICWHVKELLDPKIPVYRMVFHEITKTAITKALKECRDIDMNLVRAQEARRILDRLFGFTLSPLIWKKIAYGLSAGRVQSPALRILVEREFEIIAFQKSQYWDIVAHLGPDPGFQTHLISYKSLTLAQSKHFNSISGRYEGDERIILLDEAQAKAIAASLHDEEWSIISLDEKNTSHRPPIPFTTSTLQQAANRNFGWSTKNTMRVAQGLYEQGFITYMRTDSPSLSREATEAARSAAKNRYGAAYITEKPRYYASRSKLTQEAHEAIRPAGSTFIAPEELKVKEDEAKLYSLIYRRSLASQMENAKKKTLSIKVRAGEAVFAASHTVVTFAGFMKALFPDEANTTEPSALASLKVGNTISAKDITPVSHETRAPSRYTEAALVQRLEEVGIGRPSTYASIISTLFERKYVTRKASALVPTYTGIAVTKLLTTHFKTLIKYEFTSDMETVLDQIAAGTQAHNHYLQEFYLGETGLRAVVEQEDGNIDDQNYRKIALPHIPEEIRISRYGAYLTGKDDVKVNISDEIPPAELTQEYLASLFSQAKEAPKEIGIDPDTGKRIYCRNGRYGPYLQLGEDTDSPKPKRVKLNSDAKDIDLEEALKLLSLPRILGKHPESGQDVIATIGPYGPYVGCEKEYRSLKEDNVYTVALDKALELLSKPKSVARRRKKKTH